jgi:GNAT superfamily N-acetyltransferase
VSEIAPIDSNPEEEWAVSWEIREATHADVPAVAVGINRLLEELGGKPGAAEKIEQTAHALIDDSDAGVVLVAENLEEIVGVLGVSWQIAMRIPGRYGVIQEFWVHPAFRGMTIGGELVVALFELARRQGVTRLEVGLPSGRFPQLAATEAFYLNNGFTSIGMRMRRLL